METSRRVEIQGRFLADELGSLTRRLAALLRGLSAPSVRPCVTAAGRGKDNLGDSALRGDDNPGVSSLSLPLAIRRDSVSINR